MKVTCPISGIAYTVLSAFKGSCKHPHPIFSETNTVSYLISNYLEPWSEGVMNEEDTHLLGLAFLLKLPVSTIPSLPASACQTLSPFWAKYLERLAKLATKLDGKDFKKLPKLAITLENLPNLPHWIDTLYTEVSLAYSPISEEAKKRNNSRYRSTTEEQGTYSPEEIDSIILRGLKKSPLSAKESRTFPKLIANWACNVGAFPTAYVKTEDGRKIVIAELWKDIIEKAFSKDGIMEVLSGDVTLADAEELLEYCYCEIPAGSTHASFLFKKLEEVREVLEEFRSEGRPQVVKAEVFKGSEDDLLALLAGESNQTKPNQAEGETLSPSQKLAIKMAAMRSKTV